MHKALKPEPPVHGGVADGLEDSPLLFGARVEVFVFAGYALGFPWVRCQVKDSMKTLSSTPKHGGQRRLHRAFSDHRIGHGSQRESRICTA